MLGRSHCGPPSPGPSPPFSPGPNHCPHMMRLRLQNSLPSLFCLVSSGKLGPHQRTDGEVSERQSHSVPKAELGSNLVFPAARATHPLLNYTAPENLGVLTAPDSEAPPARAGKNEVRAKSVRATGDEDEDHGKNMAVGPRTASCALYCRTWPWPRRQNGSCIREELKLNRVFPKAAVPRTTCRGTLPHTGRAPS